MLDASDADRQLALVRRSGALPPEAADLLRAAHRLEEGATGSTRREAFRVTRLLLGGLAAAGYSIGAMAAVLGISTGTVRSRAQRGPIGCYVLASLLAVDVEALLRSCARAGVAVVDGHMHSDDLVRVLDAG